MRMEIAREKEILPLHEFGWLHNDERATFWLCSYLFYSDNYNKMITGIENSFIQNASIMPGTIQYPLMNITHWDFMTCLIVIMGELNASSDSLIH